MSAVRSLLELGCYQYGSTKLKNGRNVPYTVRFPAGDDESLIDLLAGRAAAVLPWGSWSLPWVVGIAMSGVVIARGVWRGLSAVTNTAALTTIDPGDKKVVLPLLPRTVTPIIVDNAITTGDTLKWAARLLKSFGHRAQAAVRFFDREEVEPNGQIQTDQIRSSTGISVHSLLRVRDLLQIVADDEKQIILAHLVRHGTPDVQEHVEATYVFQNGSWLVRGSGPPRDHSETCGA